MIGNAAISETNDNRILIKGQVFAKNTRSPLSYVNVFPEESNYGTFTNTDGAFELLVRKEDYEKKLVIFMVGFKEQFVPMDTSRRYQIFLDGQLEESKEQVATVSVDEIMDNFRNKVRDNYPSKSHGQPSISQGV